MKSYLVSALKVLVPRGPGALANWHDGAWLVWEPGVWKAPRSKTVVLGAGAALPTGPRGALKGSEALAIALPTQERVTVGRAPSADVSINDGTLSGFHLALKRAPDGAWQVEDLGSTNGTLVDDALLRAGLTAALKNGSVLKAGEVVLTFQTAEGLWARLTV
ncbi:MAG: FHA domain-containing protein [Myxococcaceae bacterium]|nr:FHA domain-containing protein [Myxococcaceae bacterium]